MDIDFTKLILINLDNPLYTLSINQIIWIQTFIAASPNTLANIITDINNIISDNTINIYDIPAIIKLIADIYNNQAIKVELINSKNIITFVKYSLHILIESNLFILPDIEKKVIEYIIDKSIDLLSLKIEDLYENKKLNFKKCIFC
jgi:hypothetical protein